MHKLAHIDTHIHVNVQKPSLVHEQIFLTHTSVHSHNADKNASMTRYFDFTA